MHTFLSSTSAPDVERVSSSPSMEKLDLRYSVTTVGSEDFKCEGVDSDGVECEGSEGVTRRR